MSEACPERSRRNALNRLTHKGCPDSTGVDYVYDLVGKIKQATDPTGTYGFDWVAQPPRFGSSVRNRRTSAQRWALIKENGGGLHPPPMMKAWSI
jgi:hypothetical protein